MVDVGYQHAGSVITVIYSLSDDSSASVDFCAARIDAEQFRKAYNALRANGLLELDSFADTKFSGKIKVNGSDKLLYTSIPYDESWNITVDGEPVSYDSGDIVRIGDALIGVRLTEGEHDVAFHYRARGLSLGLKLTALGILLVGLWLLWKFFLVDKFGKKLPEKIVLHPDWQI